MVRRMQKRINNLETIANERRFLKRSVKVKISKIFRLFEGKRKKAIEDRYVYI